MAWKLKSSETKIASEKLVKEFVEMEPAPHQREIRERRMMVYERIWRANHFRPVVWASAVCYETNGTYRANGTHTSLMLSKHNLKEMPPFYVTVERYECETLHDVAALYGTFDSGIASRNATDINGSFAATIPELRETPVRLINLAVSAIANHKWSEWELMKVSQAERAEELLDNIGFVEWLHSIIHSTSKRVTSTTRPLLRAPVVTAMRATYERGPVIAKNFWEAVRDESAPNNKDATRTLARFLVRVALSGGRFDSGNGTEKRLVTAREVYVKCVHAWNAWRANELPNTLNYHAGSDLPKIAK